MTVRTRAQLLSDFATYLADNFSGDISPSDIRQRFVDTLDSILLAAEPLRLSTTPTPTADGEMWWDSDDDAIVVGTGSAQKRFYGSSTGVWTPALAATGATFNYAFRDGVWTRFAADLLRIEFRIQLATSGNTLTANPMTMSGLPTAHAAGYPQPVHMGWSNFASSMVSVVGILASSGTTITMGGNTAAAASVQALNANALSPTLGSVITGSFVMRV